MQYYIKEREWKYILSFLRTCKGRHTKLERRLRLFIEAVWYGARSGCQWRLLSPYYGCWRATHQRFKSWSDKGIWAALFKHLQIEPETECMMIDATIVRAHACSAGYGKDSQAQEALGGSKDGTTKIHALVDALGNLLKFILSPGQRHEITQSEALAEEVKNTIFIADCFFGKIKHFRRSFRASIKQVPSILLSSIS